MVQLKSLGPYFEWILEELFSQRQYYSKIVLELQFFTRDNIYGEILFTSMNLVQIYGIATASELKLLANGQETWKNELQLHSWLNLIIKQNGQLGSVYV